MKQFKVDFDADINGTSLKGHVTANYNKLVKLFGEPMESDGYKVSGEWVFTDDDGNVFTLYDWKSTELYDDELPSVKQFRRQTEATFNVGGRSYAGDFIEFLEKMVK